MNLNNTDYKLTMYKKYIIGLFTLCCAGNAAAQSLAQAKQLFLNGEFEQAKPAFQKLVKQAPSYANDFAGGAFFKVGLCFFFFSCFITTCAIPIIIIGVRRGLFYQLLESRFGLFKFSVQENYIMTSIGLTMP